jgi:hypothetical protein
MIFSRERKLGTAKNWQKAYPAMVLSVQLTCEETPRKASAGQPFSAEA